jgi:hypothetical protein
VPEFQAELQSNPEYVNARDHLAYALVLSSQIEKESKDQARIASVLPGCSLSIRCKPVSDV